MLSELCIAHVELECSYSIDWGMLFEKRIIQMQLCKRNNCNDQNLRYNLFLKLHPRFHQPAWTNETIGKQW